jgi:hypothetical protein
MRGQVRPKQLPTTSSSVIPVDSFNKALDNELSMPIFDANGIFTLAFINESNG